MKRVRMYLDKSGVRLRMWVGDGDLREEGGEKILDVHINDIIDAITSSMPDDDPVRRIYLRYLRTPLFSPDKQVLMNSLLVNLFTFIQSEGPSIKDLLGLLWKRKE